MPDVTRILKSIEDDDPHAAEELLPLVCDELRKLAAQNMAKENPCQTLQPTALVDEAYIRLIDAEQAQHWDSRGHFSAAVAEAMRRILVDEARRKNGPKAGGKHQRVELSDIGSELPASQLDDLALSEALDQLAKTDARVDDVSPYSDWFGGPIDHVASVSMVSPSDVGNRNATE